MNTLSKTAEQMHDHTKDFLLYCSPDTYTHSRIYSTTQLLRALQTPAFRDIPTHIGNLLYTILVHKDIHGSGPEVNWEDEEEIKSIIKTELERQVRAYTGSKNGNIAAVDINTIREERKHFIENEKTQKPYNTDVRHQFTQGFGPRPH